MEGQPLGDEDVWCGGEVYQNPVSRCGGEHCSYLMVSSQYGFKVENGLKQGCPLSPLLYSIYVNGMVEKLEEEGLRVKEGEYWCGVLLHADDI